MPLSFWAPPTLDSCRSAIPPGGGGQRGRENLGVRQSSAAAGLAVTQPGGLTSLRQGLAAEAGPLQAGPLQLRGHGSTLPVVAGAPGLAASSLLPAQLPPQVPSAGLEPCHPFPHVGASRQWGVSYGRGPDSLEGEGLATRPATTPAHPSSDPFVSPGVPEAYAGAILTSEGMPFSGKGHAPILSVSLNRSGEGGSLWTPAMQQQYLCTSSPLPDHHSDIHGQMDRSGSTGSTSALCTAVSFSPMSQAFQQQGWQKQLDGLTTRGHALEDPRRELQQLEWRQQLKLRDDRLREQERLEQLRELQQLEWRHQLKLREDQLREQERLERRQQQFGAQDQLERAHQLRQQQFRAQERLERAHQLMSPQSSSYPIQSPIHSQDKGPPLAASSGASEGAYSDTWRLAIDLGSDTVSLISAEGSHAGQGGRRKGEGDGLDVTEVAQVGGLHAWAPIAGRAVGSSQRASQDFASRICRLQHQPLSPCLEPPEPLQQQRSSVTPCFVQPMSVQEESVFAQRSHGTAFGMDLTYDSDYQLAREQLQIELAEREFAKLFAAEVEHAAQQALVPGAVFDSLVEEEMLSICEEMLSHWRLIHAAAFAQRGSYLLSQPASQFLYAVSDYHSHFRSAASDYSSVPNSPRTSVRAESAAECFRLTGSESRGYVNNTLQFWKEKNAAVDAFLPDYHSLQAKFRSAGQSRSNSPDAGARSSGFGGEEQAQYYAEVTALARQHGVSSFDHPSDCECRQCCPDEHYYPGVSDPYHFDPWEYRPDFLETGAAVEGSQYTDRDAGSECLDG